MAHGYSVKDTNEKTSGNIHEQRTVRKLLCYDGRNPFLPEKPTYGAKTSSQRYP